MNRENFITIPPGMDSRIHGQRPLVIHEMNVVADLSYRLLARLARVVLHAFPGSFPANIKTKTVASATPIPV